MKYNAKYGEIPMGPYTLDEIRSKIASGTLHRDYLAKGEDQTEWSTTLGALVDLHSPTPVATSAADRTDKRIVAAHAAPAGGDNTLSGVVTSRYRDAYLVARAATAIGNVVKFIGIALGILLIVVGIIMASRSDGNMQMGVAGVLAGLVVGIPLYVLGILVSAHGQVLKATLDTSVHTSPFLRDEQKAKVMSLY